MPQSAELLVILTLLIFSDIFLHERFFAGSLHNDLALLRLAVSLDWEVTPQVSPACLPEAGQLPPPGTRCWVTGWGQDAFMAAGELQAILQEVDVPIVGPHTCQEALRHEGLGRR